MQHRTTQTTRSHGVNTTPIYLPDWKGRRVMAWVTATLGLLLLTFDGLSMEAVLCCLSAAGTDLSFANLLTRDDRKSGV